MVIELVLNVLESTTKRESKYISHTVKIQTKFLKLDSLKRAFEHFGWTITEKGKARTYGYDSTANKSYDFVAVNPSQDGSMTFDLGITQDKDGELELFGDMWGGSIAKTLGDNLSKLKQEYAYRALEQQITYNGVQNHSATIAREICEDGSQLVNIDVIG